MLALLLKIIYTSLEGMTAFTEEMISTSIMWRLIHGRKLWIMILHLLQEIGTLLVS